MSRPIYFNKQDIPEHLIKYFEPANCGKCYVCKMVGVFREVKRVLKKEGTLWLNLGDSYWGGGFGTSPGGDEDFASRYPKQASNKGSASHETRKMLGSLKKHHAMLKPKDLVGIPWRVAFALQSDGWYLRQDIIWHKPNPMPESVTDRCTKAHEYIFLMSKDKKYYFDNEAIKEDTERNWANVGGNLVGKGVHKQGGSYKDIGDRTSEEIKTGRNKRSVWTVTTKPFKEAHFATFPEDLINPMILAGCPKDGTVLDCFFGAGTTGVVAKKLNRHFIGIELSPEYIKIAEKRILNTQETLF